MPRGDAQRDLELARSVRPGRRFPDHDRGDSYDGEAALWPRGAMEMDPARHEADGCWASLTAQKLIGSGVSRWRVSCRHCRGVWHGWSEKEAMEKARVAHGDA